MSQSIHGRMHLGTLSTLLCKQISIWDGSWEISSTQNFLYDGWNLVAVYDAANSSALVKTFTWGRDLSGTLQGAGGVGGLLSCQEVSGASVGWHYYLYDANGNVTNIGTSATSDGLTNYEYDPYGNITTSSGNYTGSNNYAFATKFQDDEVGLLYYGYRFYLPTLGRWISRDPLGENGGLNRYGLVYNDPVDTIDYLGLVSPVTVTLKNCEILILYGHGSSKTPHKFNFQSGCSAGTFVGCHSSTTNSKIPAENQVPGAPSTDDELNNYDQNPDLDLTAQFNIAWDAALKQAKEICKKECKCKSINVHSQLVGSGWDLDNWGEPSLTKQQDVKCDGK